MKLAAIAFGLGLCGPLAAAAAPLPQRIDPQPPFPAISRQAPTIETIAPGIDYGEYSLETQAGPLAIHVVSIAPGRRNLRVAEVQAQNAMTSRGETVGAMAVRTGAVAGINGDYFDIGNTNRPLNIVVRDGVLLQLPRKRYALAIGKDGVPSIAEFSFSGTVAIGGRSVRLDGVNQMPPPNGGLALLTPAYGSVAPSDDVTLIALQPMVASAMIGDYRVLATADNLATQPPGYYLAIGINAFGSVAVPNAGDTIGIGGDLAPGGLANITQAIGGGPLILHAGTWLADPDGPNGGEYDRTIPSSGLAIEPDGTLLLLEVDGRQPGFSVGLTRHQFAALMRALGASEGMALDGGGSSTLAVRRLGAARAEVVNRPSDGIERPVGNGLFAYDLDPVGPPVRLIARPNAIRAMPGAQVRIDVTALDAANHVAARPGDVTATVEPAGLGSVHGTEFTASHAGSGTIRLRGGGLNGSVALEVTSPAQLRIEPPHPNVDVGGTLNLNARAFDAAGYPLEVPATLRWSVDRGTIDPFGRYTAGPHNAKVTLRIAQATAETVVTVGTHRQDLGFAPRARFATIPRGGAGSVANDPQCAGCVNLTYAFSGNERAAYAIVNAPMPSDTIGLSLDVRDDGSGGRLKIALRNAINESVLLDLTRLDRPGWRHVEVRFPPGTAPAKLTAIYVLPPPGMQVSSGEIGLRNVSAIVAGQ